MSSTMDKNKKRGGIMSPPIKNDYLAIKKPFIQGFQNNLLTPKNNNNNRVKTKSLYDPNTLRKQQNEEQHKLLGLQKDNEPMRKPSDILSNKVQKSKSSSSFDDLEDNVDEFLSNENQNFQKIKNPSLMSSIVTNSNRHIENSHQASSLVIPS